MRLSFVHRKKRVGKHVISHATSLHDRFCFVECPVNTEIDSALAVFLFRLRKRGEAARHEWAHIATVVSRHAVEFVGNKGEGDLICPIKFAQRFEKRASESTVPGRI